MLSDIVCGAIKQLRHSLLRAPDSLIAVHNLHSVLLSFNLENQKLSGTIPYLKLLRHSYLYYRFLLLL